MNSKSKDVEASGDNFEKPEVRNLEEERQVFERILSRFSEASKSYSVGKFRSV